MVLLEVLPGKGPVGDVQVLAEPEGPVRAQDAVPVGALAPERPVIVAVYVIVPPSTGLDGADVTTTVGATALTTMETGACVAVV